jgi:hypothetical protein
MPNDKPKILVGHVSPETAFHVDDYPYGFRLRCQIRYWLEYQPGKGVRFWSQTTNPKRGHVWNKPKASTYSRFGGCMYLNQENHVTWAGLTEYSDGKEARHFLDTYGAGVPPAALGALREWVAAKEAYDAARKPGDDLGVGLVEAREAWVNVAIENVKAETE